MIVSPDRQPGRRASDPTVSAWVDASAGTGKTTVLTSRVLRLLLSGAAPDRILCITFTRAAAAEMSNRIIQRLGKWAVAEDGALFDELTELNGARPDLATQTRARQLFAAIVDAPAGFRIQTIHAFCQSVLRRFPLEAGLAPHFDLLDDRTAAELLGEAQQAVLVEAGRDTDGPLGRALAVLVEYMDERGFGSLIETVLSARRRLAHTIDAHGGVGLLVPRMWRGLGLEPGETAKAILAEACRDGVLDRAGLSSACDALSAGSATDQKRAAGIAAWLTAPDRALKWADYIACFLTKDGQPSGTFRKTKAHAKVADILDPEADRLVAVLERLRAAATAAATEAMLTVGGRILEHYKREKQNRALLDYDDLIDVTRQLVETDASWVLYKLDGGIEHLLVDEAQDTNPDQWGIIKALAGEFFAGKGAREANRTIFVVGDRKQSIYSFQGADPAVLAPVRAHFEQQIKDAGRDENSGRDTGRKLESVDLTKSYRSTDPILRLVDAVFANPSARDGVHEGPDRLVHDLHRVEAGGLVELWQPFGPVEVDEEPALGPHDEVPAVQDPETQLAVRIARTIRDWLDREEPLAPGGRPVTAGDVMILVRRRTRFVGPMVRALKALKVPVAGVDRLALTEPLAIRDLMALGRFLLLPDDDLTLASLLKSPLIGIDETGLYDLAYGRKGTLWNALLRASERDAVRFEPARAWLSALLDKVDFVRPFELFAGVLAAPCPGDTQGSGRRALHRRLGPDVLDPLDEFLSAALDYERGHTPTLEGFVGWLEASDAEIKRELAGRGDAVRIVTVHGAKGLEAPIVFLPDTMQVPAPNIGPQLLWAEAGDDSRPIPYWSPRADLRPQVCANLIAANALSGDREYRRLLYVALTRAQDRLYVAGWHGKQGLKPGHWYGLVEEGMRALGAVQIGSGEDAVQRLDYPGAGIHAVRSETRILAVEPLPGWARQPPPPEPRPFVPLTPSRIEFPGSVDPAVSSPASPGGAQRFRRGLAVHRLLQLLPNVAPADRAARVDRLFPELDANVRAALLSEVTAVIDAPGCVKLFGPGSRAEVPIVGRIGVRGVTGRIDRLLVEPGQVTIVDFKSSRLPPGGPDDVPAAYLAQMAAYRAILRQIYPDHRIGLVLVWTDGPAVTTLDEEKLDPYETYLASVPDTATAPGAA
ncbi:MAG TPA: double-strand break repair helicase AddA [Alphaproteobacteria bacterium]|nr:double-strand break repair helicase AddA [Alphaproteobacteria bacterium]